MSLKKFSPLLIILPFFLTLPLLISPAHTMNSSGSGEDDDDVLFSRKRAASSPSNSHLSLSLSIEGSLGDPEKRLHIDEPKGLPATPKDRPNAISTEYLILAPTYEDDVSAMYDKGPGNRTYVFDKESFSQQRKLFQESPEVDSLIFTHYSVFLKETGEIIGHFNFLPTFFQPKSEKNNTISIDFGLAPACRGNKYGSEMLQAMTDQVIQPMMGKYPRFSTFRMEKDLLKMDTPYFPDKLTRIFAGVHKSNAPALQMFKSCGWKQFRDDTNSKVFYLTP